MSVRLHSEEIENAVLSLVMQYPDEILQRLAVEGITKHHFYTHRNSVLFEHFLEKKSNGVEIELITICDDLERKNLLEKIGGREKVAEVYTFSPSRAYLSDYIERLRNYHVSRMAYNSSQVVQEAINDDDPHKLVEIIKEAYQSASEALSTSSGVKTAKEACDEFVERIVEDNEVGDTPGIQTGLSSLDVATGGLRKRELWVVAGQTSGGKSVLALQCVASALRLGKKCLVFSLEMGAQEVAARLSSCMFSLDFGQLMNPRQLSSHSMAKVKRSITELASSPLWVVDEAGLTIDKIEAKAIQMNDVHDIDLIVVDYIQLVEVQDKRSPRHEQIAKITRDLKQLAKKINCPVITASQLNDEGKLRESRAIGHDADVVTMIGEGGLSLAKNRNGKRGVTLPLFLQGQFQIFHENKI